MLRFLLCRTDRCIFLSDVSALNSYRQVLHLVGMALLEEQQQLENSSGDDDITFNYTCKITRQHTKTLANILNYYYYHYYTSNCMCVQVQVKLPVLQEVSWLC